MTLSLVTIIDLFEKGMRRGQAHFHLELKDLSLAHTFTLWVRRHWMRRLPAQNWSARWVWARFQHAVASHILNAWDICISKRHSDSVQDLKDGTERKLQDASDQGAKLRAVGCYWTQCWRTGILYALRHTDGLSKFVIRQAVLQQQRVFKRFTTGL